MKFRDLIIFNDFKYPNGEKIGCIATIGKYHILVYGPNNYFYRYTKKLKKDFRFQIFQRCIGALYEI